MGWNYISIPQIQRRNRWCLERISNSISYFMIDVITYPWWISDYIYYKICRLSALLAICAGNSPVPGEFPAQRPVTRNFDVFFDLHPKKLLSKQSWGWWFETPSRPLWRYRNDMECTTVMTSRIGYISRSREADQTKINTLRPRQNERHFADDIFTCIFLNETVWISIKISLKFVPQGPIDNIPALVQIMAWRRPGDKPLSGPMMVRLPTHICVTRPQ